MDKPTEPAAPAPAQEEPPLCDEMAFGEQCCESAGHDGQHRHYGGFRWVAAKHVVEGKAEAAPAAEPSRCLVTGNECGTDTWPVGQPCKCAHCARWLDGYDKGVAAAFDERDRQLEQAEAELAQARAGARTADNQYVEMQATIEAMLEAAAGEPVSDFWESHSAVRRVMELRAEAEQLRRERDEQKVERLHLIADAEDARAEAADIQAALAVPRERMTKDALRVLLYLTEHQRDTAKAEAEQLRDVNKGLVAGIGDNAAAYQALLAEAEQLRRERDAYKRDALAATATAELALSHLQAARTALAERERAAFMAGCAARWDGRQWHFDARHQVGLAIDEAYAAWQATQPLTHQDGGQ